MGDGPANNLEGKNEAVSTADRALQVRHIALTLLATAIAIYLLQTMQSVLIPFVVGALLFYALDPAVDWLQKVHVPRAVGAAVMLMLVMGGCGRSRMGSAARP